MGEAKIVVIVILIAHQNLTKVLQPRKQPLQLSISVYTGAVCARLVPAH